MKTRINYSVTIVGSAQLLSQVPMIHLLTPEQNEELRKTTMVTSVSDDRVLSMSVAEIKVPEIKNDRP